MGDIVNLWQNQNSMTGIEWKKEVGVREPRILDHSYRYYDMCTCFFTRRDRSVRGLKLHRTLERHIGSVNSLQFSEDGVFLLSGSQDQRCILWNWQAGKNFSIETGHTKGILNVQFLPCSNDNRILTAGADGQVRLIDLTAEETLDVLGKKLGKVHKMAIVPGNPHTFYACSGNGFLTHFDLRAKDPTMLLSINNPFTSDIVELYDIANDPTNAALSAVAGSDILTRICDIRKCDTVSCVTPNRNSPNSSGISSLAYSKTGELLASYRHSDIYLFSREEINSGWNSSDTYEQKVYKGHKNEEIDMVQRVTFFGPSCEYVVSGSDSGHAFIWRTEDGRLLRTLQGNNYLLNCTEPHPQMPVLATGGIDHHIKVWAAPLVAGAEPEDFTEEINESVRNVDFENTESDNKIMPSSLAVHASFLGVDAEDDSDDDMSCDNSEDFDDEIEGMFLMNIIRD